MQWQVRDLGEVAGEGLMAEVRPRGPRTYETPRLVTSAHLAQDGSGAAPSRSDGPPLLIMDDLGVAVGDRWGGHPLLRTFDVCSNTEGMDDTGKAYEPTLEEFHALVRRLPEDRQREIAALVKRVAAEPDPEIRAAMIQESEAEWRSGRP